MITYKDTQDGTDVLIDGRKVGTIECVTGGYAYCTKDGKHWGDTFPTSAEVKRSLEQES